MITPAPMLTPRSAANKMGAAITRPHPMESPALGSVGYRNFAQADANSRAIAGMAKNTSAAAPIAVSARPTGLVVWF
jgi:hypothetical protein